MRRKFTRQLTSAAIASIIVAFLGGMTFAQDDNLDLGDQGYATGLVFEDQASYNSIQSAPVTRAFLPEEIDLSPRFPPVMSQGKQGSCTAWATGYAARSYYATAVENRNISLRKNIPSPAFIYNSIKDTPGDCKEGTVISVALELLKTGALSLDAYGYDATYCDRPTTEQASAASDFKIDGYARLDWNNLDQVKGELAQGNPVIIGMETSLGFHKLKSGQVYSSPSGKVTGAHAVTLVGYDENKRAFKLINSWGTDWADDGYGWIDYDLFPKVVHEALVIRMAEPPPSPIVPEPIKVEPPPAPTPPGPTPPEPLPPVIDESLPHVTCGRLELKGHQLSGYVGDQTEFDAAAAYAQKSGATFAVDFRPWPQCEALNTLRDSIGTSASPTIVGSTSRDAVVGQPIVFEIETPDYTSFIHIAYVQADGTVANLLQSPAGALKQYPPHTRLTVGDGSGGLPVFTVSPPLGREMLVVVSSPSPLFSSAQPPVQTEREFLSELREALVLHRKNANGDVPGATVVTVITKPKE